MRKNLEKTWKRGKSILPFTTLGNLTFNGHEKMSITPEEVIKKLGNLTMKNRRRHAYYLFTPEKKSLKRQKSKT